MLLNTMTGIELLSISLVFITSRMFFFAILHIRYLAARLS